MEPRSLVAAIDQGTTSSRCILFDRAGRPVASHQLEHAQITPRPGWVEHDADEILERVRTCVRVALREAGADARALAAVGISDQRETTVVWDRADRAAGRTTRSSGRTPGPPTPAPGWLGPTRPASDRFRRADRAADLDLLLRAQARLDPRGGRSRQAGRRRVRRPAVRDDRFLAHLAADRRRPGRRPRDRRHERVADDADGPRVARLGACAARCGRHPRGDAARDPLLVRGLRGGRRRPRRRPDRGRPRRPACRAVRPDLLRAGADASAPTARAASCSCTRASGRSTRSTASSRPSRRGSATRPRRTRSRAPSRSPGRWSAGCATTWGSSATPPRSRRSRARCPTAATSCSCPRSPACSRRTGGATPGASSPV